MKSMPVGVFLLFFIYLSFATAEDYRLLPPQASPTPVKEQTNSEKLTGSLKQDPLGKRAVRVKGGPNHNQIEQLQWGQDVDRRSDAIRRQKIPTHY